MTTLDTEAVMQTQGEMALRAIHALRTHLKELEVGVKMWPEYRPSVPPIPSKRHFDEVILAVEDFREAAKASA